MAASYNYQAQRKLPVAETTPGTFSSWKKKDAGGVVIDSLSHHVPAKKSKVEETDEDLFTVPEVETQPPVNSVNAQNNNQHDGQNQSGVATTKRRRGRNPIEKEYKRLKRLLRNRVSAQQARERKKVYVSDLETRAGELQEINSKLQEKISNLTNENAMLRKILMNTRRKVDENADQK